ncbi:MAG: nitrate reductase [Hydrococcus sp. Prado102]|nr:nitrate reductase [Hydrococcus sp. Prado102]
MTNSIKTLCPYCGVGCGLEVSLSEDNSISKVRGDKSHPSNQGMVCVKGATIAEALDKDRLLYPMMRESLNEEFRRVSWDEALERIVNRIQSVRLTQGADAICMYGSGQLQTEDYYIAQKLMKGCLGTNNFDANSRLCMSSAVAGYLQSFGSDGPPCCYEDLDLTDFAFIIGSNMAECHPILFNRLHKRCKQNPDVKIIVVDPRDTPTVEVANLHLAIRPGTDIDLLNGMAYLLMQWGKLDRNFIDNHTVNFPAYVEAIEHYPAEIVARRCNISIEDLETAARYWGESQRVLSLWSMGMNQSSEGTAKVRSLIDLHLLTGQIGKPGVGPFSLTGQPNAMGGREAGGLSHLLPGYRSVKNPQHRTEVEQFWGLEPGSISPHPGKDAWSIIVGLEKGEVGLLWIAATNPAVTMPDLERTKAALLKSPFTVYQDAYYPTETAAYAHLFLPAAQWGEKAGTMTNSERVVTFCPQFRDRPGEAKADWEIFAQVGRRLGFAKAFDFVDSAAVYREFVKLTRDRPCDLGGVSHERLQQEGSIQWPCPLSSCGRQGLSSKFKVQSSKLLGLGGQGGQGLNSKFKVQSSKLLGLGRGEENLEDLSHLFKGKRLYTNWQFNTPDGRARFGAFHSRGLAEPPDEDFPFVLTTGRVYEHWHTMTRTGRIEKLTKKQPQPFLEIHPRDAERLGIENEAWVEVRSRRGMGRFLSKVTKAISPGTVFVPMHWGALWADNGEVNALAHSEACPISLEPELKAMAVQLLPMSISKSMKLTRMSSIYSSFLTKSKQ